MYRGEPGGVICSAGGTDIAFPMLYRIAQTSPFKSGRETKAERSGSQGWRASDDESYVHWTIHNESETDHEIPHRQFRAPTLGLAGVGPDHPSAVIRWHPSHEHWECYQDAVDDLRSLDPPEEGDEDSTTQGGFPMGHSCQTADGIFSFEWRETDPRWPAPLVIYIARVSLPESHPARRAGLATTTDWYAAYAPDDTSVVLPDLEPKPE